MSIAVVHEWITARAGSEKVFERLAQVFPEADLFALSHQPDVELHVGNRVVRTTVLDRASLRDRRGLVLPLMPLAWSLLARETTYETVVTSSHAFAREFYDPARHGRHFNYVHAPMRYAWDRSLDPRTSSPFAAPAGALLRRLDRRSVDSVHAFAANSRETKRRLRHHYGVEAEVIHPPVDTSFFAGIAWAPLDYVLSYGRFIDYKRFDLSIDVASKAGIPLVIAGRGPLEQALRSHASSVNADVRFVIDPPDQDLRSLVAGARALLFPGVEDFGIVPVEAQSVGVPVVGPRLGGLLDTVDDGTTGVLADGQDPGALTRALMAVFDLGLGGDPCRRWTEQFSGPVFDRHIRNWVQTG